MSPLRFHKDGAELHPATAAPFMTALYALAESLPSGEAGVRLTGVPALSALLAPEALGLFAREELGERSRPVRAILFDKTIRGNWALGWHQDRTIAVQDRRDVGGFGPWSRKAGIQHVEPPFAIIERMMTIRIHLDPVPADNAPLKIAPGSHLLGRIAETEINAAVARCGIAACLAERGDVWVYATPILHGSARSERPAHRRVLQVDFSAHDLPSGLEWLGV